MCCWSFFEIAPTWFEADWSQRICDRGESTGSAAPLLWQDWNSSFPVTGYFVSQMEVQGCCCCCWCPNTTVTEVADWREVGGTQVCKRTSELSQAQVSIRKASWTPHLLRWLEGGEMSGRDPNNQTNISSVRKPLLMSSLMKWWKPVIWYSGGQPDERR